MKINSLFILILFIFGCSQENIQPVDNQPDLRPLSAQELQLVESSNEFALKLTKKINDDESGNFFISPLSVGYALGMTFNGAAGDTKAGIKQTLDFGDLSDEEINLSYKKLTDQLVNMDKKTTMEIANSIWYKQELTVKNSFKDIVTNYYDAGIRGLDFGDPASVDVINTWIENKTHDKIKDMLDAIPGDAVMYLVNAIYFKSDWTHQFDKSATKKEPFKLEDGSEKSVDMMFSKGVGIGYAQNQKFSYLELPYGNRQFAMAVLLPNTGFKTDDVMGEITAEELFQLSANSRKDTVEVKMPKFKMEYKKTLNETLMGMGMEKAFSPLAEFPDLFDNPLSLMISRVLHQSFIEVNEEGSEAAAATVVEIVFTSVPSNPVPKRIVIDKPFVFFIIEKHTQSILFAGKLMEP